MTISCVGLGRGRRVGSGGPSVSADIGGGGGGLREGGRSWVEASDKRTNVDKYFNADIANRLQIAAMEIKCFGEFEIRNLMR